MTLSRICTALGLSLSLCLLLACGCGKGGKDPNKLGAQYDRLFASADPETKACWEAAKEAMKTNGYAATIGAIRTMLQPGKLTPEQAEAAQQTATAASDRMYAEANKGDTNAQHQIDELRKAYAR